MSSFELLCSASSEVSAKSALKMVQTISSVKVKLGLNEVQQSECLSSWQMEKLHVAWSLAGAIAERCDSPECSWFITAHLNTGD